MEYTTRPQSLPNPKPIVAWEWCHRGGDRSCPESFAETLLWAVMPAIPITRRQSQSHASHIARRYGFAFSSTKIAGLAGLLGTGCAKGTIREKQLGTVGKGLSITQGIGIGMCREVLDTLSLLELCLHAGHCFGVFCIFQSQIAREERHRCGNRKWPESLFFGLSRGQSQSDAKGIWLPSQPETPLPAGMWGSLGKSAPPV